MEIEGAIQKLKNDNKELKHLFKIVDKEIDKYIKDKAKRNSLFYNRTSILNQIEENENKIKFYERLLYLTKENKNEKGIKRL